MSANTPKSRQPFGVVILAAGASSRMGRPKLLLKWGDTTVIGHIIRQWQALNSSQIVIVHRRNDSLLLEELVRLNFPSQNCIENPDPDRGMFSSIQCTARWTGWMDNTMSRVIVLGDQPHLRPDTLQALMDFHFSHAKAICQPVFEGRERHPVMLPNEPFNALTDANAETLKDFLKLINCPRVLCPMEDPGLALDMDTPEDYNKLKHLISAK